MLQTVHKFRKIIFTAKKSRMIVFLLIVLFPMNGVYSSWADDLATQGQFNYVVSIQRWNSHFCTGTIIDETHVLTIGHLFFNAFKSVLSVVAGTARLEPGSVHPIKVKNIYLHPLLVKLVISGSSGEDWEDDIAIIELEEKFQWSTHYGPIQPTIMKYDWLTCQTCIMVRWSERRTRLTQIWTIVFRLDPENCVEQRIDVGNNQQCFMDESFQLLITSADLGSPIVCGGTMVGFVAKKPMHSTQGQASTLLETVEYSEFIQDVIIKGLVDAPVADFPYIVTIWYDNSYICSGSILDETHILTTAYCIQGKYKAKLKVVHSFIGESTVYSGVNELRNIKTKDDIALLVLARPVSNGRIFKPLDYLNTKVVTPGLFCDLPLWKDDGSMVKYKNLKKARVRISTKKSCQKAFKLQEVSVPEGQFCARNQHLIKVTDLGDSGSPLICKGKLTGILMRASPLNGPVAESVFLEIDSYKEFIQSTLTDLISFDSDGDNK